MRIGVLIEHRQGKLRDVSFELLTKGRTFGNDLIAVLLAKSADPFLESLKGLSNQLLIVEDARLENFNPEYYQLVLKKILVDEKIDILFLGHTASGYDLAPVIAKEMNCPIVSDCIDFTIDGDKLIAIRNVYGGKVNTEVTILEKPAVVSLRPATFTPESASLQTEIKKVDSPINEDIDYRRFVEYVEAAVGDVDITKSDVIVAVGRGIREDKNLPIIEDLAGTLGGVVACTRPVVDAGWLPKERQVGSSGKTVKPKLYIAVGVSGAFQHLMGMRSSGTIIAINKDPEAPIFNEADYGIVDDLFKVVPILKNKLAELKG